MMDASSLLLVWRLNISPIVASTSRWELECLDGEGEILIVSIIDKEPVVDGLLKALSLVTGRHQGTSLSSSGALFNTSSLGKSLVVSLYSVNNNSPLAISVDSTQGLDVSSH